MAVHDATSVSNQSPSGVATGRPIRLCVLLMTVRKDGQLMGMTWFRQIMCDQEYARMASRYEPTFNEMTRLSIVRLLSLLKR